MIDRQGYIVKQVVALKQKAAEAQKAADAQGGVNATPVSDIGVGAGGGENADINPSGGEAGGGQAIPPSQPAYRRFYMSTPIDNTRVNRDIGRLMDEVINNLIQVEGVNITIRLDVEATMSEGVPVPTVRVVTKNCKTLRVEDFGFEE